MRRLESYPQLKRFSVVYLEHRVCPVGVLEVGVLLVEALAPVKVDGS